jgi:hypothetical protein
VREAIGDIQRSCQDCRGGVIDQELMFCFLVELNYCVCLNYVQLSSAHDIDMSFPKQN